MLAETNFTANHMVCKMKSGLLLFANDRKNFASIENHERWKSFKNGYYSGPPWLHSWLNMVVRTPHKISMVQVKELRTLQKSKKLNTRYKACVS
jgi:hypothetical protein